MTVRDQEARFVNYVGRQVKTTESVLVSWDNGRRASWTVIVGCWLYIASPSALDLLSARGKLSRVGEKEEGKVAPACS